MKKILKALSQPRRGQKLGNLGLCLVPVGREDDVTGGQVPPHGPGTLQIPSGKEGRVEGTHRGARHGGYGLLQPQITQGLPHANLIGAFSAAARQHQSQLFHSTDHLPEILKQFTRIGGERKYPGIA